MANGVIDWTIPPAAKPDWLFGAGATRAERAAIWAGSAAGVAFVLWQWVRDEPGDWSWWQYAVAAVIAFDLVGGAVSNAASSTKRQYYAALRDAPSRFVRFARSPLAFASMHVYPFVVVALYPGGTWTWAVALYGAMVGSVLVVDRLVPQYLQRPVAMLLFVVSLLATGLLTGPPPGWEWLPVVFLAKLLLAHAVREEPYRPALGT